MTCSRPALVAFSAASLLFAVQVSAADPEDGTAKPAPQVKKKVASKSCDDAPSCFARCEQGGASACEIVGGMFEHGIGVERNLDKASEFYLQACRGGDKKACRKRNSLGVTNAETAPKVAAPNPEDGKQSTAKPKGKTPEEPEEASAPHQNKCQKKCSKQRDKCMASAKAPSSREDTEDEEETAPNPCELRSAACMAKCDGTLNPSPEGIDPFELGDSLVN